MSEDIKKVFKENNDVNNEASPDTDKQTTPTNNKFVIGSILVVLIISGFIVFGNLMPKKKTPKTIPVAQNQQQQGYSEQSNNGSAEEQLRALRMDNEELRKSLEMTQKSTQEMYSALSEKIASQPTSSNVASTGPVYRSSSPYERFSSEYQSKVKHFKENASNFWAVRDDEYSKLTTVDHIRGIPSEYQNISQDSVIQTSSFNYLIPSGSRIIAVTEQAVNSDHPGFFTSRIVRPYILKDAKLICQSGPQQNNRIPVNVVKVILNNREYALQGQIEMTFPGLSGHVKNHVMKRMGPALVNAAIGGGFLAWSLKGGDQGRIDTRDAIVSGVVEQSVSGVQNEVTRLGGDFPNTVEVPQGQQFTILITEKLEVKY